MAAGKSADAVDNGEIIVVVGLFIQIVFFGLFVVTSAIFHSRLIKDPTARSHSTPWRRHIIALYGASTLILIRSVFRAIEYIQGNTGYLLTNEVFLYIFDALLMATVVAIFNLVHPSEIQAVLTRDKSEQGDSVGMHRIQHSSDFSTRGLHQQKPEDSVRV